ncbi:hypothetical protein C8F04DRAFT_1251809 [Mycena alexandri]|uniref:Uncharacterized protein n=1 Tax=Mycena alexandri TaxID=1745969 RepID=A0AAD6X451_9AGAR|nr:hypothetical protein C8F04DRAFT_1256344 [Mycena alexandri]KAJ7042367.1 hypothetical protein C8F04DRAFT_1251809 [Mycena alexandri]
MALPSQVQTLAATQTELSQEGPQVYPIRSIDPRSKRQREHHILQNYPAPNHMLPPPDGSPAKPLYHMLCFTMFGQPSLEPIWAAIALHRYANDDEIWDNGITDTQNRLGNMIVVAGILLASATALASTVPPRPDILNYTVRGPYLCIRGSFGFLVGGIIVGSVVFLILGRARAEHSREVLYTDRFQVWSMGSYTFFSIGTGTHLLAFGMLSGIWCAQDATVQAVCALLLVIPVTIGILFGIVVWRGKHLSSRPDSNIWPPEKD